VRAGPVKNPAHSNIHSFGGSVLKRLLSSLFALAFAASLASPAFAAAASPAPAMSSMKSSSMKSSMMSCPKGQSYTTGYTKKDGTKVKGYCHKSK
jgi:hypothetical protein